MRKDIEITVDLEDWEDDELIEELRDRNYRFIKEVDLNEAIDFIESCGYRVDDSSLGDNILENLQLEELISNFLSADFAKREEILKIK